MNLSGAVTTVCAECRVVFPVDELIRHGNVYVCADCKPVFMQKLVEGAEIGTGKMRYAGFWLRLGAIFLDSIILIVIRAVANSGLALIAGLSMGHALGTEQRGLSLTVVLMAIQLGTGISYETILIGKYGATLGKMACKIYVVTAEGGRVSYLRACGRYFARVLSAFTLLIGYIMAAFDPEKRTLHDRICNTRVVLE